MSAIWAAVSKLFKPAMRLLEKRVERKMAKEKAAGKLAHAKAEGLQEIQLNKDEWEQLQVSGMGDSWKDEYVTVSVISVLNLVVIGGVASAFGYPQILEGVGVAVLALTSAEVDVAFLLEATVLAGLGLSIWKRM